MYSDILGELGLTKNEAKIYETLLREGESSVALISKVAEINRRNVYDSLNRLEEKGLIFEIRKGNENSYQAVDPVKLMETVKEKEETLNKILPELQKLHQSKKTEEGVYVYRGIEGWKNYMRDILRIGEDSYSIGAEGLWSDPKLKGFLERFVKEAEDKNIGFHVLFDHGVKKKDAKILKDIETNHKFLPEGYDTDAAVDIFGDNVVITHTTVDGKIDENTSCVVIRNQVIADSFRTWHKLLWEVSGKLKKKS